VRPLEPGFRRILIQPQPGSLEYADLTLPTVRGQIRSRLENRKDEVFRLRINLPANTTARVCLPRLGSDDTTVCVDGQNMKGIPEGDFVCVDPIGSGEHIIEIE